VLFFSFRFLQNSPLFQQLCCFSRFNSRLPSAVTLPFVQFFLPPTGFLLEKARCEISPRIRQKSAPGSFSRSLLILFPCRFSCKPPPPRAQRNALNSPLLSAGVIVDKILTMVFTSQATAPLLVFIHMSFLFLWSEPFSSLSKMHVLQTIVVDFFFSLFVVRICCVSDSAVLLIIFFPPALHDLSFNFFQAPFIPREHMIRLFVHWKVGDGPWIPPPDR